MKLEGGFGWIRVGTATFEHDIVIHTDGKISKRKKKASKDLKGEYGHTPLSEYELDFIKEEKPDRVFIGTGHHGALPLTPGALHLLGNYRAVILPTPDLLIHIEAEGRPYVAILHVTC